MKRIILMAMTLIMVLALSACSGGGNSETTPTPSEPSQGQDGRGDILPDDFDNDDYFEPNDAGWNMDIKTGVFYYLDGEIDSDSMFFYEDNTVDCDWPGEAWNSWPYYIDGNILTITDGGDVSISFVIEDDGNTLVWENSRYTPAGDGRGDILTGGSDDDIWDDYFEAQTGGEPIAYGVIYTGSLQISDFGDNMSPYEAASGLYSRVLREGYEYSEENMVYIMCVDIIEIDGGECYLFEVSGPAFGNMTYAVNYDYDNQNVYVISFSGPVLIGSILDLGRAKAYEDADWPLWWGEYKCDDTNFSIGITNFNGRSFLFSFYNLRNGELFYDGAAGVYSDDGLMAEYGEISFALKEDFGGIDISVPASSEWAHLSGLYERID